MKYIILLFSILLSLNLSSQKNKGYICSWNSENSENKALNKENFTFYEKGKIFYSISNNKDNVILDIKVEDASVQGRILKEGMTIWINMDGKQDKKMGIRFPIGSQHQEGRGNNQPRLNPDGTIVTPLSQANEIELTGFTGENSRRFHSENNDTFNGYVRYDNDGVLHYRMVMPSSKLPFRNTKEGNGTMPFNFGIEYGTAPISYNNRPALTSVAPSGASSGRGGSSGRGRGGSSAGGEGRGMPGSGTPANNAYQKDAPKPAVSFWIKGIRLATNI